MKLINVVMPIMLMLVACKPTNDSEFPLLETPDLHSNTTEPNSLTEKPVQQTITSTPVLLIPVPSGIIYRTDTELWRVEKDGNLHLVYQFSKGNYVSLSPNNTHVLYWEYNTSNNQNLVIQHIVDLATLNKTSVYPHDHLNICPFSWMPGRSDIIYTVLLPDDADPSYSCARGSPVFLSIDGSNLIVLDKDGLGWSSPSVSPNGEYVAFDKNGEPWLYEWEKSSIPFDMNNHNTAQSNQIYFLSPSWSPNSTQLAWITVQKMQDSEQREIKVFDIRDNSFTILSPCNPENKGPCGLNEFEGKPRISWSGDGTYLSVINHALDSYGIYSLDGNYERMFDDGFYAMEWSPIDTWYARVKSTKSCPEVFVESVDGEESHQVGCGRVLKWSSNGKNLIFGDKEHGWWLVDIKTWSVNQINMPYNSEIIDWINLPTQE